MKIRILIADDHAVLRAGLRMLIEAQPDMKVVGEAADGSEVVQKARETKADVVLMDLAMPGGGSEPIVEVLRACPKTRVLVLTMYDDPAYARSVLGAGASGYLAKKAADSELLSAIRAVHRGRVFVDVSVAGGLPAELLGRPRTHGPAAPGAPGSVLSPREREVLELLALGHTNREIAERIGVGVKTVETYRSRLAQKLGLRTRADVVAYALESGLLVPQKPASRGP